MTGIEKIIGRIEADALLEAERILSHARGAADETAAEYQKKADALKAELTRKGEAEAAERRKRAVGVAELEARKRLLETKQRMIDNAFQAAREKLAALPAAELVSILARLASGASRTGNEELVLSAADREAIGANVVKAANKLQKDAGKPAGLTLSQRALSAEDAGGVLLAGDNIEVNCTFAALLGALRDEMAPEIAGILFSA
ncbi:MAG: hypothetical protein LBR76_05395 [Oscillospiraceae bacterium]|nr:hypothetical protein [Oscillospiraceae bacterium]